MSRDDWSAARNALLTLAAVITAGIAVHFYAHAALLGAQEATEQQRRVLHSAQMRVHRSGEERELIVGHLDAYRRLADEGFVGDERRIAWLDALRVANESTGLFGVDYHIAAQRPYSYSAEMAAPELVLQESVMKMKLRLLHEGDLLRFFTTLARQNAGLFVLDQCSIQRLDGGDNLAFRPHLAAECDVSWITAKPAASEMKR